MFASASASASASARVAPPGMIWNEVGARFIPIPSSRPSWAHICCSERSSSASTTRRSSEKPNQQAWSNTALGATKKPAAGSKEAPPSQKVVLNAYITRPRSPALALRAEPRSPALSASSSLPSIHARPITPELSRTGQALRSAGLTGGNLFSTPSFDKNGQPFHRASANRLIGNPAVHDAILNRIKGRVDISEEAQMDLMANRTMTHQHVSTRSATNFGLFNTRQNEPDMPAAQHERDLRVLTCQSTSLAATYYDRFEAVKNVLATMD